MVNNVRISTTEFSTNQKYGGQDMRTYAIHNAEYDVFYSVYSYESHRSEVQEFDTIEEAEQGIQMLEAIGEIKENEWRVLEYTESKTFVIVDKEDGQLLTDDDGDIIKYGSRLWAEGYVRSRGWEDEVIIIDITKLIK